MDQMLFSQKKKRKKAFQATKPKTRSAKLVPDLGKRCNEERKKLATPLSLSKGRNIRKYERILSELEKTNGKWPRLAKFALKKQRLSSVWCASAKEEAELKAVLSKKSALMSVEPNDEEMKRARSWFAKLTTVPDNLVKHEQVLRDNLIKVTVQHLIDSKHDETSTGAFWKNCSYLVLKKSVFLQKNTGAFYSDVSRHGGRSGLGKKLPEGFFRRLGSEFHGYEKLELLFWKCEGDNNPIQGKFYSHRLAATIAVPGRTKEKWVVDHVDGNPSNNAPKNLRWVTVKENCLNKVCHRLPDLGAL